MYNYNTMQLFWFWFAEYSRFEAKINDLREQMMIANTASLPKTAKKGFFVRSVWFIPVYLLFYNISMNSFISIVHFYSALLT